MKRFQGSKASKVAGLLFAGSMAFTLTGCMTLPGNHFSCSWPRLRSPFSGAPTRYADASDGVTACGASNCGATGCGTNGQPAHSPSFLESSQSGHTPLPTEPGGYPPSSRDPQVAPDPDVANRWTPPRSQPGAILDEYDPVSRISGRNAKPVLNSVPPLSNARPDLAPPVNGQLGFDNIGNPIGSDPNQHNAFQVNPYDNGAHQSNPDHNGAMHNGGNVGQNSLGGPHGMTAPACEPAGSSGQCADPRFGIGGGPMVPVNPFTAGATCQADSVGTPTGTAYLGGQPAGQIYGHSMMAPPVSATGSTPFGMHTGSAYPVPHPSVLRHRDINSKQQARCPISTGNTDAECRMQILPHAAHAEGNRAAANDEWSRIPAPRSENLDDRQPTSNARARGRRDNVTELAPPQDFSTSWNAKQPGDADDEQPLWGDGGDIPAWQNIPPQAWVTRDVTPKSNHADSRTGISRMSGRRQSSSDAGNSKKLPRPWKATQSVNWTMPPE